MSVSIIPHKDRNGSGAETRTDFNAIQRGFTAQVPPDLHPEIDHITHQFTGGLHCPLRMDPLGVRTGDPAAVDTPTVGIDNQTSWALAAYLLNTSVRDWFCALFGGAESFRCPIGLDWDAGITWPGTDQPIGKCTTGGLVGAQRHFPPVWQVGDAVANAFENWAGNPNPRLNGKSFLPQSILENTNGARTRVESRMRELMTYMFIMIGRQDAFTLFTALSQAIPAWAINDIGVDGDRNLEVTWNPDYVEWVNAQNPDKMDEDGMEASFVRMWIDEITDVGKFETRQVDNGAGVLVDVRVQKIDPDSPFGVLQEDVSRGGTRHVTFNSARSGGGGVAVELDPEAPAEPPTDIVVTTPPSPSDYAEEVNGGENNFLYEPRSVSDHSYVEPDCPHLENNGSCIGIAAVIGCLSSDKKDNVKKDACAVTYRYLDASKKERKRRFKCQEVVPVNSALGEQLTAVTIPICGDNLSKRVSQGAELLARALEKVTQALVTEQLFYVSKSGAKFIIVRDFTPDASSESVFPACSINGYSAALRKSDQVRVEDEDPYWGITPSSGTLAFDQLAGPVMGNIVVLNVGLLGSPPVMEGVEFEHTPFVARGDKDQLFSLGSYAAGMKVEYSHCVEAYKAKAASSIVPPAMSESRSHSWLWLLLLLIPVVILLVLAFKRAGASDTTIVVNNTNPTQGSGPMSDEEEGGELDSADTALEEAIL